MVEHQTFVSVENGRNIGSSRDGCPECEGGIESRIRFSVDEVPEYEQECWFCDWSDSGHLTIETVGAE